MSAVHSSDATEWVHSIDPKRVKEKARYHLMWCCLRPWDRGTHVQSWICRRDVLGLREGASADSAGRELRPVQCVVCGHCHLSVTTRVYDGAVEDAAHVLLHGGRRLHEVPRRRE